MFYHALSIIQYIPQLYVGVIINAGLANVSEAAPGWTPDWSSSITVCWPYKHCGSRTHWAVEYNGFQHTVCYVENAILHWKLATILYIMSSTRNMKFADLLLTGFIGTNFSIIRIQPFCFEVNEFEILVYNSFAFLFRPQYFNERQRYWWKHGCDFTFIIPHFMALWNVFWLITNTNVQLKPGKHIWMANLPVDREKVRVCKN